MAGTPGLPASVARVRCGKIRSQMAGSLRKVLAAAAAGAISGALTPSDWLEGWIHPGSPSAWRFYVIPVVYAAALATVSRVSPTRRLLYFPLVLGSWVLAMGSLNPLAKVSEPLSVYGSGAVGAVAVGLSAAVIERTHPGWWVYLILAAVGALGNFCGGYLNQSIGPAAGSRLWFALWQAGVAAVIVWSRERRLAAAPDGVRQFKQVPETNP
jgi:hypothetical protein